MTVEERSARAAITGAFEVIADDGMVLHSKLTVKGHGKCETRLERQRVLHKLKRLVTVRCQHREHESGS